MEGQFAPAIAALQEKLAEQHRAVLDTKRSINLLLKMAGEGPQYAEDDDPSSSSVRQDQFYGKALTAAAAEYLAMRKQACQPAEIVRALEAGGFDFDVLPWKKDDRVRPFTISLSKNTGSETGKFHKLKNGSFGLKAWYEEDFLKKAGANAEAKAKSKKKKKAKKKASPKSTANGSGDPTKKDVSGEQQKKAAQPPGKKAAATSPPKPKSSTKAGEQQKEPTSPLAKSKSSAKSGRPAADQTAQKEGA